MKLCSCFNSFGSCRFDNQIYTHSVFFYIYMPETAGLISSPHQVEVDKYYSGLSFVFCSTYDQYLNSGVLSVWPSAVFLCVMWHTVHCWYSQKEVPLPCKWPRWTLKLIWKSQMLHIFKTVGYSWRLIFLSENWIRLHVGVQMLTG